MWLRLRQIAGVAAQLKPVEEDLVDVLGIAVCYRDPHIDYFGLENALFPIGNQLLEVVAPIQEKYCAVWYIERRGGDGVIWSSHNVMTMGLGEGLIWVSGSFMTRNRPIHQYATSPSGYQRYILRLIKWVNRL